NLVGLRPGGHSKVEVPPEGVMDRAHLPEIFPSFRMSGVMWAPVIPFRASTRLGLPPALFLLALVRVEQALAQADALGGHLHELVTFDVAERLFQAEEPGRGQANALVLAGGANVGELLGPQGIDLQVVLPSVLADDHALVKLVPRGDEDHAPVFQVPEGIGGSRPRGVGDEHTIAPPLDRALVGAIAVEEAMHDAGSASIGQEVAVIADQSSRGGEEDEPLLARS